MSARRVAITLGAVLTLGAGSAWAQAGSSTTSVAPTAPTLEATPSATVAPTLRPAAPAARAPKKVAARPKVRAKPKAKRRRAKRAPVVQAADAGVTDAGAAAAPPAALPSAGWTVWDVGPPTASPEGASPFERIVERLDAALWPVVQVVGLVFLLMRLLSWLVRRRAHGGSPGFIVVRRGWVFVEGSVWLLTGIWAIAELSARQSPSATLLALLVFGLMVALSWNGLRDVAAGLMLAAERPFALGDHVVVEEGEGIVRAFRSRVLELQAPDGLRIRVPYRRVLNAARIRKGGRRTTYAVHLELMLPDTMDPSQGIKLARELAASSPWAVLGEQPRIELLAGSPGPRISVVGFAFRAEAQALLHADLLHGWRELSR